jgi:hypothetical protein
VRDVDRPDGEMCLAGACDVRGAPFSGPGAGDDHWSQRGDGHRRLARVGECPHHFEVAGARGGADPFASKPEARALVAKQRTKPPGARPLPVSVVTDDDGAGAREHEYPGLAIEGAPGGGLGIGNDMDATAEAGEAPCGARALGRRPDPLGRNDERGHTARGPAVLSPDGGHVGFQVADRRDARRGPHAAPARAAREDANPRAAHVDPDDEGVRARGHATTMRPLPPAGKRASRRSDPAPSRRRSSPL